MTTIGNTGQRYKLPKLIELKAVGNIVLHVYSCGHQYETEWETPERASHYISYSQGRIGKRQRCSKCPVEKQVLLK
jgi:hypothetical protein